MGETCGLKLVYETRYESEMCRLCHDIEKKVRRYEKMQRDIHRWQREGNRSATIERTTSEMEEVGGQIGRMRAEHSNRENSTQVSMSSGAVESEMSWLTQRAM
jgi:hypothetical protein